MTECIGALRLYKQLTGYAATHDKVNISKYNSNAGSSGSGLFVFRLDIKVVFPRTLKYYGIGCTQNTDSSYGSTDHLTNITEILMSQTALM
jgi:hypothetical protein